MGFRTALKARIDNLGSLRRAVSLVWNSSRAWTIASFVILVIQGLLPLVSLYILKLMLDAVGAALAATDKEAAFQQVVVVVVIAGIVSLLSNLVGTIGGLVTTVQGRLVADHMSDILHAKSIEIDLDYYENSQYFDTLHRAQQEAPYRPLAIVSSLAQIVRSAISLAGIGALLLTFHPVVVLLLAFAVVPAILVRLRFVQVLYRLERQHTITERRSWYYEHMLIGQEYAKEIRIFDLGNLIMMRFRAIRDTLRGIRLRIDIQRSVLDVAADMVAQVAVYGSFLFVGYRTVMGNLTLGDLVMFYQAFQRGQGFLQSFLNSLASLYEHNVFIANLYEFLDVPRKVLDPEDPVPPPQPIRQGIEFRDVRFRYPTSERSVLEGVNLTIRPGEVVALVGANGSGKTTLVKLLCRLYDPDSGSILLDGIDLRRFTTNALRREISVIFQDYAHYNLSAAENIGFGDVTRTDNRDAIIAAAQHSDAHETITSLPQGYDTVLGKMLENGEELSIGQWQKIALARAFLRESQVIVLDEPTSAMDAKAEAEVFEKFRELLDGRTAILISHRLSTVRMADMIYVLDDGRIIESGSHDELIDRRGTYAHLFETQARYYREDHAARST